MLPISKARIEGKVKGGGAYKDETFGEWGKVWLMNAKTHQITNERIHNAVNQLQHG